MAPTPTAGMTLNQASLNSAAISKPASTLEVLENDLIALHSRLVTIGDNLVEHLVDVHGMDQNEPESDPAAPPHHARIPRLHQLVSHIEARISRIEASLQPVLNL